MPRIRTRWLAAAGLFSVLVALPASAIEMFTYFGDGSRIGLPSLEVPVQAYPGIPLRSDRIRARSKAQQARRSAASNGVAGGANQSASPKAGDGYPGIPGGGITIRPMPRRDTAAPATIATPKPAGASTAPLPSRTTPEPVAPPRETPLPGFSQPVFPSGR